MLNTVIPPLLQSRLIGHQSQWDLLTRQFDDKKLHPAWLLGGQKGIGKSTFAYQIARYILKNSQNNDGFIDNLISQKSHPNLLVIEKNRGEDGKLENEISIESIRKIAAFVHQSSAFPGWRIIIIDAVEDLNRNAANALLKILEEPPKNVLILLVCHSLGRILPTIRSRCCLLSFSPLTAAVLKDYTNPSENSSFALDLARGSIGRLQELQQVPLLKLAQQIIAHIEAALRNQLSVLQQFTASYEKGNPEGPVVLELLNWIAYSLVLISHELPYDGPEVNLSLLAQKKSPQYWVKVQENLAMFLQNTEGAHLDMPTVLLACFLVFENPSCVKELVA